MRRAPQKTILPFRQRGLSNKFSAPMAIALTQYLYQRAESFFETLILLRCLNSARDKKAKSPLSSRRIPC